MMSEEVCPWNIDFEDIDVFYYDKLVANTWNPIGNGIHTSGSKVISG